VKARVYKEAPGSQWADGGIPWACHVEGFGHNSTIRHRTWQAAMLDACTMLNVLDMLSRKRQ